MSGLSSTGFLSPRGYFACTLQGIARNGGVSRRVGRIVRDRNGAGSAYVSYASDVWLAVSPDGRPAGTMLLTDHVDVPARQAGASHASRPMPPPRARRVTRTFGGAAAREQEKAHVFDDRSRRREHANREPAGPGSRRAGRPRNVRV